MDKVREELTELSDAINEKDHAQMEEEMGDLLLSITSLCRKLNIDPEVALNHATDKFIDRFEQIEKTVLNTGKTMEEVSSDELNRIWDENKHKKTNKI